MWVVQVSRAIRFDSMLRFQHKNVAKFIWHDLHVLFPRSGTDRYIIVIFNNRSVAVVRLRGLDISPRMSDMLSITDCNAYSFGTLFYCVIKYIYVAVKCCVASRFLPRLLTARDVYQS